MDLIYAGKLWFMGKEKDEWGRGSLGRRGKGQSREGKRGVERGRANVTAP